MHLVTENKNTHCKQLQSRLPELQQFMNNANPAATLKQARKNMGPSEDKGKETVLKQNRGLKV